MIRRILCGLLPLAALESCALPSYDNVSQGAFSCPDLDPPGEQSAECLECLRVNCCEAASACTADDECATQFGEEITPFSELPGSFLPSLGCMQRACDAACNVSFGCEGTDYLPRSEPNEDGEYAFALALYEFAKIPKRVPVSGVAAEPCSGVTLSCGGDLASAIPSDQQGLVFLTGNDDLGQTIEVADPNYDALASDDLSHYPPHLLNWSQPLHETGALGDFIFSSNDVKNLVEIAALGTFSREDSHIVFYMHNCLPLGLLGNASPHAGVDGASIALTSRKGETAEPVYRDGRGFAPPGTPTSAVEGSGGAAIVSPGRWTAEASVMIGDRAHTLSTGFEVPAGGVGVVHLFPSAR